MPQRTCVVLSTGDFGVVPPCPAVPVQPSHVPCSAHLGLSAGGMSLLMRIVVAPSLGTRDTQASALLCKGEFHCIFMLEEGKAIIFPITFNKI